MGRLYLDPVFETLEEANKRKDFFESNGWEVEFIEKLKKPDGTVFYSFKAYKPKYVQAPKI